MEYIKKLRKFKIIFGVLCFVSFAAIPCFMIDNSKPWAAYVSIIPIIACIIFLCLYISFRKKLKIAKEELVRKNVQESK